MDLTLTRTAADQIAVACDGTASHAVDLRPLLPAQPLTPTDPDQLNQGSQNRAATTL